jgi:hypothetical protein
MLGVMSEPVPVLGADRRERVLEIVAVVMLSLASVGIAWSSYQAAKWSGLQAQRYTQASAARSLANRASTLAGLDRTQDLLNFNRWLEVSTQGKADLAAFYGRRFRPEFRLAFAVWIAADPLHHATAVASPLLEPQYKLANAAKASALEMVGDQRFEDGKSATEHADQYVFVTVFFAVVLFFAGISLRFNLLSIRIVILAIGAALLAYGAVRLGSSPTL